MNAQLQIGELAQALGLNPKTIRYYEEIGLLPLPQRSASGYRLYSSHDAEQLRFILKAKAIGFTLDEIRDVVTLQRSGKQPCCHVETLLEEKVAAIDAQLQALAEVREELVALHKEAACSKTAPALICGIIEQHEV